MRLLHLLMGLFILRDLLTVHVKQLPSSAVSAEDHLSFGSVDFHHGVVKRKPVRKQSLALPYELRRFPHVWGPPGLLKNERHAVIFVSHQRRIRDFRVVMKTEISSGMMNRF